MKQWKWWQKILLVIGLILLLAGAYIFLAARRMAF